MKKTRKILSEIFAVAMFANMSVLPVCAESNINTLEEFKNYFNYEIGYDISDLSDAEIQELFELFSENDGVMHSCMNDDSIDVVTVVAVNSFQHEFLGEDYGDFKYIIKDGEAYITHFSDDFSEDKEEIIIPEEINGCKVVSIGGYAFHGKNIKTVVLPNTLREIGWYAFSECHNLSEIKIADSDKHSDLQSIHAGAFAYCENLKEVTCFADSDLNDIQRFAFGECTSLEKFEYPAKNNYDDCGIEVYDEIFVTPFYKTQVYKNKITIPSSMIESFAEKLDNTYQRLLKDDISMDNYNWDKEKYEYAYREACKWLGLNTENEWDFTAYNFNLVDYSIVNKNSDEQFYTNADIEVSSKDFLELPGDVNFDGVIDIKDLEMMKNSIIGITSLSPVQKLSASVDNTAIVDIRSVTQMKRYIVKLIDEF